MKAEKAKIVNLIILCAGAAVLLGLVVTLAVTHKDGSVIAKDSVVDTYMGIEAETEMAPISAIQNGLFDMVGANKYTFDILQNENSDSIQSEENNASEETVEEETTTEEKSPFEDMFVTNVKEYMNVRAEATTESEIVGKLYAGAGGTVIEKGEEWSLITSGNVTGYVYNKYVEFGDAAEELAWEMGNITAVATVDSLRIREGDSTSYDIVCVINKGTKVEVKEKGDAGWSEVIYGKYMGYCSNDYLEFTVDIDEAMTIEEEAVWLAELEAARKAAEEEAARKAAEEKAAIEKAIANSKFVEVVKTSAYNVTEEDAYLLACLVHAEAHSTTYEGKLAVANVVLNRLNGGYYGDSISDVVNYPNQFSVVKSGVLSRVIKRGPNADCIQAAKDALSGINNVPNYANFCMVSVANFSKYAEYTIIDSQVFYRRK